YQRGQNERLNRDIRRFIPKSFSIKNYSAQEYAEFIRRVNDKPRRKFQGLSAKEHFEKAKFNFI
ncbi:MAG: IS30 family transposase, partial [Mycoplasmatales bacterium]